MTETWTHLDPARLRDLLAAMEGKRILILGDVILDRYLWGNVSRISPEAPVPVVEVDRETMGLGGAANVAQNVLSFHAVPELVGVMGDDETGRRLRLELENASISPEGMVVDPARVTTLKTRIVARGQHMVRADQENRDELSPEIQDTMWDLVRGPLDRADAVVISDYGKGVVTRTLLDRFLERARERGVPVCVDPKDTHFFSYTGVSVVTPNQHEAAEVLGYKLHGDAALERAGWEIQERLGSASVLITRGEQGMTLFEQPRRRTDFPVTARKVYDVTGAGDTVVTSYAVALAAGAEPREAALISTHAAGLVVSEVGTAVPSLEDLVASFVEGG